MLLCACEKDQNSRQMSFNILLNVSVTAYVALGKLLTFPEPPSISVKNTESSQALDPVRSL